MKTIKEVMEILAQLPEDEGIAIPIMWTRAMTSEIYTDELKEPLTNEQWLSVIQNYFDALTNAFWDDSDEAMRYVLRDADLFEEE